MTAYLLDANVFIEAKNRHYGFDFCPAFWDWLIEQNHAGTVASIKKVAEEPYVNNDEHRDWARTCGSDLFLEPDESVGSGLHHASECVSGGKYRYGAVAKFLDSADYLLIAHGLAHERVVVTHEVKSDSERKVKIPSVCASFDLRCMTPYEMLRREKARFVLETGTS